jgi:hypothetical protein
VFGRRQERAGTLRSGDRKRAAADECMLVVAVQVCGAAGAGCSGPAS